MSDVSHFGSSPSESICPRLVGASVSSVRAATCAMSGGPGDPTGAFAPWTPPLAGSAESQGQVMPPEAPALVAPLPFTPPGSPEAPTFVGPLPQPWTPPPPGIYAEEMVTPPAEATETPVTPPQLLQPGLLPSTQPPPGGTAEEPWRMRKRPRGSAGRWLQEQEVVAWAREQELPPSQEQEQLPPSHRDGHGDRGDGRRQRVADAAWANTAGPGPTTPVEPRPTTSVVDANEVNALKT